MRNGRTRNRGRVTSATDALGGLYVKFQTPATALVPLTPLTLVTGAFALTNGRLDSYRHLEWWGGGGGLIRLNDLLDVDITPGRR